MISRSVFVLLFVLVLSSSILLWGDSFAQSTPIIIAQDEITLEATGPLTELSFGNVTTSFGLGYSVLTWTITDQAGNTVNASQIITIQDTTPPAIMIPDDYIAEATGPLTALSTTDYGTANATDLVDANPAITSNAPSSFPLWNTTVTWTATDDYGNNSTDTQMILVLDTTPPTFNFVPQNMTFVSLEDFTLLDPSQIGFANATDTVDSDPIVTNNAPDSFMLGPTTITWTATDLSGNTATATQTITIEKPPPVIITAPSHITVDATGILTYVDIDGLAQASGSLPITLTHNATSSYLPIGDTVISWIATDAYQISATAHTTITITADTLDSDWYYKLIETSRSYIPYSAVAAAKAYTDPTFLSLSSSDVNVGTIHLFKSFPKTQIQNHNMTLEFGLYSKPALNVYLLDGSYSITEAADFISTQPASKGGGMLYSYAHNYAEDSTNTPSNLTLQISPDWSSSELDTVTLFIDASRPPHGQRVYIGSLQIDDHSKWIFEDYKVQQGAGTGTYVLVPPTDEALVRHQIPTHDSFDDSFDGWTYWGSSNSYVLDLSATLNRTSVHVGTNGFGVTSGIAKLVDVSSLQDNQQLMVSTDFRAASLYAHIRTTNAELIVYDADSGDQLYRNLLVAGGTRDTGWQTFTADLTDHISDSDAIQVVFYTADAWSATYRQDNWYDDIRIYTVNSGGAFGTSASIVNPSWAPVTAPPQTGNTTSMTAVADVMDIMAEISQLNSDSMVVRWYEPFDIDDTTQYSLTITTPDDGYTRTINDVTGTKYHFADLEPETEYEIIISVQDDDSTRNSILYTTTLPES